MAVETVICALGMDIYGMKAYQLEKAGQTGSIYYLFVGVIWVFFLATAFGNLWKIYSFGRQKVEELQKYKRCDVEIITSHKR